MNWTPGHLTSNKQPQCVGSKPPTDASSTEMAKVEPPQPRRAAGLLGKSRQFCLSRMAAPKRLKQHSADTPLMLQMRPNVPSLYLTLPFRHNNYNYKGPRNSISQRNGLANQLGQIFQMSLPQGACIPW